MKSQTFLSLFEGALTTIFAKNVDSQSVASNLEHCFVVPVLSGSSQNVDLCEKDTRAIERPVITAGT